ncbi:hypothetical protein FB567DRAFT_534579 [Paraphoma chrysanthemicola]|uniref:Uncharacterized protein n=1 Tax=Paraphoma chrysanthemicola TaxID=798071 RepID=A0A8K0QZR4_9PLEO|nr:hypothetical protein FB567DRAFT_534579 [Paraphoma chrysanthemicola]
MTINLAQHLISMSWPAVCGVACRASGDMANLLQRRTIAQPAHLANKLLEASRTPRKILPQRANTTYETRYRDHA